MPQTFEELIGFHLDDLYSAALCFTLDEHRAEELLQEASIRAFHEFSDRRADVDFRYTMLSLLVSTYLQRQRRKGCDPLAGEVASVSEMLRGGARPHIEPFPERGTSGYRLLSVWLRRAWPELSDGDRLVLWLADVEGLRHSQVAEMLGLSVEEVRSRHYRARRILSDGTARQLGARAVRGSEA